ncbi:MAG: DUF1573 domain-containing protein [Bacteroidetes bacterium]|nr:DUF1573 domain-containing protein [Bacteroidota bacterium]MBK9524752.1 DUF1573 domain-containing protein [Bacteroidota bacterium]MBK9542920.1 DUF1573 domain-containing protein [Bacteroidota bacterium]MBP6402747.1 DUF1573 domain-containing protein [Bacteroidia bacterium]
MKIRSLLLTFLLLGSFAGFAQDEKKVLTNIGNDDTNVASFKFETEEHNFGTITQGESVTYEFKFTNTGSEPIIISKAEGSCGCTVPIYPKEPIMKGQSSVIKVTFNSAGKMGVQDKTVTLTSNAKQNPMIIHMKGTVEKPIEQPAVDTKK